jgi:hypothetical protein
MYDYMNLCQYSDIFGKPSEGLHQYKIFHFAIVDIVLTFLAAKLLQIICNKYFNKNLNYWIYLLILLVLAIILHRIFCVNTTLNVLLFGYHHNSKNLYESYDF